VADKKSGSILVLGPRGSGKTMLVQRCLENFAGNVDIVNLNGILQTNDVAAVKAIAKQLNQSVEVEDETDEDSVSNALGDMLKRVRRPLVIVVDEFDRFALDRAPEKQSLLYSLLNHTHNDKKQLLIIGISCRLDALDSLEKRVRSRISQNSLLLLNEWSFEKYLEYAKQMMVLPKNGKDNRDVDTWNKAVETTVSHPDVKACLERHYDANRSLQRLQQYLVAIISLCDIDKIRLAPELFRKVNEELFAIDSRRLTLEGLSALEMGILVTAASCLKNYGDNDDLNFELIYKEYCKFTREKRQTVADARPYPKSVMFQAFDKLSDMGIFAPARIQRSQLNILRQFQPIKLQLDTTTIKLHVKNGGYPTYLSEWLH